MKATFTIYKIECYTLKHLMVFVSTSRKEADDKYSELNSKLSADSEYSYYMVVK